ASSWPRSTPWRADDGKAWCALCQDSPKLSTASGAKLELRSVVSNGLRPNMWHNELVLQVTWWSTIMRTRPPQRKASSAPLRVAVTAQPIRNGMARLAALHTCEVFE